jgi:DNA-binding MarR family transcriptional regulator
MSHREDAFAAQLVQAKSRNLGHLLMRAARLLNSCALARVTAQLPPGLVVRPAHTQLFPHIALEGTRQTELAAQVGITKQAVGQLVAELEQLGVVERVPDPADGRARLVRFSAAGREGLLSGLGLLAQLEAELAQALSAARIERLKDDLDALLAALEADPVLRAPDA